MDSISNVSGLNRELEIESLNNFDEIKIFYSPFVAEVVLFAAFPSGVEFCC